jgi:hypothetical protein
MTVFEMCDYAPHWLHYLIKMEYTMKIYYKAKIFLQPSSVIVYTMVNGWGRL